MKVLIVEDDQKLAILTKEQLERASFAVDLAENIEDGLFQAVEYEYDCIVLDLNLPDGSGLMLCKRLRESGNSTPILILTARGNLADKINGLDLGADDYITKPVESQELLARVRALIRRNSKIPLPVIKVGDLEIDPKTRQVYRHKSPIELPTKEYAILEFMARHSEEVVTRTMLMEHVWGSDFETFSNVIDVYIRNLRRKIDEGRDIKLIHTIRGGGYVLSNKR